MSHRRLRFFREDPETGARVARLLVLDNELNFIDEIDDDERPPAARKAATETPERQAQHDFARWAVASIETNPFPGSDELRADYFKEVERLKASFDEVGQECPACDLSKVMNKYRARLKAAGHIPQ